MARVTGWIYEKECRLFKWVNSRLQHRLLDKYFNAITHFGGATATIITTLLVLLFAPDNARIFAAAGFLSLVLSHIPVAISKKCYPRKRPYLMIPGTKTFSHPLKDHSFPSGHTTAVFSVIIPLSLIHPGLLWILVPLGFSVGISRMYLGLHYPTDVLAGMMLGISSGIFSVFLVNSYLVTNHL
ncbi:phosphatase PAP2 family protein [Fictibacillus enclensis]|uniref:Phosphoesterase n=1 Tax=Fictibacillus enclensis TaxID=1017270 RepID=A0A0V8J9I6_9BACL|nr:MULTISPECIES: phosphatase PAP2 family protein [Fictibacillus]KSU83585.1 phosphoesterase [Fictibacillus enclensis]MDM5200152.1 phosphatase PAP2 family protein [Fictibacillus enclensis]MDM5339466.1 phosphatase PAP2 family protein [Fictibacillus enclensis]RXZ02406.1 phosphatase PAP2 family protein [Fictibacillus sp. S7]WHY70913.1 phosphatase PAP2 family protein [Fictibacillus enclensis]